ncbi:MAG: hypothetical protein BGO67_04250 [Alphaproteobacteria bacterium 41-28]|nr:MAG: hypothetical protein BGO67_04250 [Alphaproteobacteria bacterium 41-28]
MQITLSVIGKLKDPALKSLFDEYKKRLEWKVALHEFEGKGSCQKEGEVLLKSLPPSTFMIILDEKGENLKSEEFAALLKNIQIHHQGKVAFVIGGPKGLSEDVKTKAEKSLSFGRLTWPHLLIRVMLMEQLYRAQQILKSHPYHRK